MLERPVVKFPELALTPGTLCRLRGFPRVLVNRQREMPPDQEHLPRTQVLAVEFWQHVTGRSRAVWTLEVREQDQSNFGVSVAENRRIFDRNRIGR